MLVFETKIDMAMCDNIPEKHIVFVILVNSQQLLDDHHCHMVILNRKYMCEPKTQVFESCVGCHSLKRANLNATVSSTNQIGFN